MPQKNARGYAGTPISKFREATNTILIIEANPECSEPIAASFASEGRFMSSQLE